MKKTQLNKDRNILKERIINYKKEIEQHKGIIKAIIEEIKSLSYTLMDKYKNDTIKIDVLKESGNENDGIFANISKKLTLGNRLQNTRTAFTTIKP